METTKVRTLIKQIRGVSYKPEDLHNELDDNSVILLRANNIDEGKINFDDVVYVDKSKVSDEQYLKDGDILICASSGSKNLVGKAASIRFNMECTFGAFCKLVRPKKDLCEYLGIYFQSPIYRRKMSEVATGANINNIRNEHIDELDIPIFSNDEQAGIVKKMHLIQEIISNRKVELEKLDNLIKARFVELFGNPIQNPKGYKIHQLSDYIISLTSGSRGWAKYCVDDGNEWFITIKNVKDCRIITDNMQPINAPNNAEAKRTKVKEGDLLISITADLGRTGVVTKEIAEHGAYINQHLSCIRIDREVLNPLFVAHYMESPAGKEQFIAKNQSAVKAGLNFNAINSLKLMVPPMEEQIGFIEFVEQVDKSKVAVQKLFE